MLRRIALSSAVLLLASGAAAQEGPLEARVVEMLKARGGFPTRQHFERAGPPEAVNKALAEIAEGRRHSPALRHNAIRALEYFPTRRTEQVLTNMLYAKFQKAAYKRTVLRALARAFGVQVYFDILPFLREADPTVRGGAAIALAEIDDGRVRGILDNHLVHEKEIAVRLAMEKAIGLVEEREKRKKHVLETGGD